MATKKLNTSELLRRVDAGDSFTEIAKDHGISRQAVQKRVRKLRGKTTKAIVSTKVEQIVDRKIDAISQLLEINKRANEMLDEAGNAPNLTLKIMAELRGQLRLQLEIFQALYDLRAAQEFQEEVLEAIGEVSPDVRSKIINKLNQRRAVRSAVSWT